MGAGGDRIKHAFIWPAVLLVLAVTLFPLVYSLSISFQQVRLVPPSPPRFVGLANYTTLLSQARFWQVLQPRRQSHHCRLRRRRQNASASAPTIASTSP